MTKINKVIHGESTEVLKGLEDSSVDSVVCDPPYGLSKEPDIVKVLTEWTTGDESFVPDGKGFMSKEWDGFVPPPSLWREVYRVLKPGGHALVFAGTRTQDLMTISLRLAGFEMRDVIEWLYFSGFPKSHDVSKAFDRRAGAEREITGVAQGARNGNGQNNAFGTYGSHDDGSYALTAPATELARKWDGWGTALKPSHEPIIVVRKPLIDADTGRKLTVADCVEKYSTGAINIDACRIPYADEADLAQQYSNFKGHGAQNHSAESTFTSVKNHDTNVVNTEGRFPANCITLDSDEFYSKYFNISPAELSKKASKKDRNSDWQGEEIDLTDKSVGYGGNEYGMNANKFRPDGSERKPITHKNNHPTVKPTDLMAWLVRLVTPEGGTVLDPFAGSGSTLVAAKREGFGFIGVELTEEYIPIIEARVGVRANKAETSEGQATE